MKNIKTTPILVACLLFFSATFAMSLVVMPDKAEASDLPADDEDPRLITITGSATIECEPDLLIIFLRIKGFDPESAMKGANIIFLALDEGELLVRDDFGTSSFGHDGDIRLGGSGDITMSAAIKENSHTVYEFSIPLDSGDEFDKVLSPGNTYNIILAVNNSSVDFDRVHSARSSGQIILD